MTHLSMAQRVAFKYQQKETKKHRVEKITETIRSRTGIGKSIAESIADAIVRGRDVIRLALQKSWPVEDGILKGPKGTLELSTISAG